MSPAKGDPAAVAGRSDDPRANGRNRFGVVALLVGLFAALPFASSRLPAGADVVTHLYSIVHVDDLLAHGEPSLRWLPFDNGGYGNPRFVFYPAAPFYLAGALTLAGAPPDVALRLLFAAALVAAALGSHRWLRAALAGSGPAAGLAALAGSAIYALSPYLLFAVYQRASFAETVALGLLPWAALAVDAWVDGRTGIATPASALAALLFAHPLTAATFALYLGGRWGVDTESARPRRRPTATRLAALLLLGLAISAASWLPALAERSAIRSTHEDARGLRVERNALPLATTIRLLPGAAAPGLAAGALLLALAAWLPPGSAGTAQRRRLAGLGLAIALVALLLTTRSASPLWEATRGLTGVFQFPHRLLGVGTLGATLAAAAGLASALERARAPRRRVVAALVAALLATATPSLLRTRRLAPLPALDVATVVRLERGAGRFGTGEKGDFVPRAVRRFPPVALRPFDPEACWDELSGANLEVTAPRCGRTRHRLDLRAPEGGVVTLRAFDFPGWRARVDGVATPIEPDSQGRIAVRVPPGAERLEVRFGSTGDRRAGALLSLLGGAVAVALARRFTTRPDASS